MFFYGMGSGTLKKKREKERDQNVLSEFSNRGSSQRVPRYQFIDNWLMFKYK